MSSIESVSYTHLLSPYISNQRIKTKGKIGLLDLKRHIPVTLLTIGTTAEELKTFKQLQ